MKIYDDDRIIAFVDILGFSERVMDSKDNLYDFESLFWGQSYICKIKEENEGDSALNMRELGFEVTVFSDSLVISCPDKDDNLFSLIMQLIHIQINLANMDILLRGAITSGPLHHDGEMLLGPAMIEAYKLESRVAVYPRIIVEKTLIRH